MNAIFSGLALSFTILLLSFGFSPIAGSTSLSIFPLGSNPYGLTYSKHIENFWNWAVGIPADENPISDTTGEKCGVGQSNSNSSVFYLTFNDGGKSERVCRVSPGMALFIPISQVLISNKDLPEGTPTHLKTSAKADQDGVNSLYLKIGDKEYGFDELQSKYRNPVDLFDIPHYADKGIFGVQVGGPTKASADGYYVITEPLQRGNYTIHYKSSGLCIGSSCLQTNYAQDIKYTIIAE